METLWPRIERLLLGVAKPARYIGGEQGAQYPEHGPGKVAWMLIYPDTYEIGLPNQGLQILYEILNERPDAAGVIAGGHCTFNPEPLADFVDAFALGDGEEIVGEINAAIAAWLARPAGERDRQELRLALAGI